MTDIEFQKGLARIARKSAKRRSAAWAAIPDEVLGLNISPITPATFDLLHGTDNAFVCGLAPVISDVRNFILYHSPGFDPDAPMPRYFSRLRVTLRIERALCPWLTPRSQRQAVTAANFLRAVREIRAIISDTWADALTPDDEGDCEPTVAACLHAQFEDMFAREYRHWPFPRPLRHTPIRQLQQLARCRDREHLGSKAIYHDPAAHALKAMFLDAQLAARPARDQAPEVTPS